MVFYERINSLNLTQSTKHGQLALLLRSMIMHEILVGSSVDILQSRIIFTTIIILLYVFIRLIKLSIS